MELVWRQANNEMDPADLLISMHELGDDLWVADQVEEALEILQECLLQRCELLGPNDEATLETLEMLHGIGYELLVDDQSEHALKLFQKILHQIRELFGPCHDAATSCHILLMETLAALGRQQDAIGFSVALVQQLLPERGENHPEVLWELSNQATLHEQLDQPEKAEQLWRQCLSGYETSYGADHFQTLGIAFKLAEVLSAMGKPADAIPLRRRKLAWCRQEKGDTDPDTLHSINQLAIDLRETGEWEESEILFRELLTSRQQVLEPDDFNIGRALGGLAKTLEAAGKLEEALVAARQCLDHRLAHQGPDDFSTNRNRLDLARVLQKLGSHSEALQLLDELQASLERNQDPDDDDCQLLDNATALRIIIQSS
jgi:tetratricopeptide (TPR) repeat protein